MNCKGSKSLTLDYFDGTLSTDQKRKLEDHLRRCEACQKTYNRISVLLSEKSRLRRFQVSPKFHEKLWDRIQTESTKSEVQNTPIRSSFLFPLPSFRTLSVGFASLLLAAVVTFTALSLRKEGGKSGIVGVETPTFEFRIPEGEIFDPATRFQFPITTVMEEEIFLLDNRSYGGDSLIYSLPVYTTGVRLVSY